MTGSAPRPQRAPGPQADADPTPVAAFRHRDDRAELARLQRLTGLDFEQVPESLLSAPRGSDGSRRQ